MQVAVRAEGPTRVLAVIDLALHVPPSSLSPTEAGAAAAWEPWSSDQGVGFNDQGFAAAAGSIIRSAPRAAPAALQWQLHVELAGAALSVVAPEQELLYARLSGVRVRATGSQARHTLELAVRHMQADNTLPSASYQACLNPEPRR